MRFEEKKLILTETYLKKSKKWRKLVKKTKIFYSRIQFFHTQVKFLIINFPKKLNHRCHPCCVVAILNS